MSLVRDVILQLERTAPKINLNKEHCISYLTDSTSLTHAPVPTLPELVPALLSFPFTDEYSPIPHFQYYLNTSLVFKYDTQTPDTSLHIILQEMMGYFLHPQVAVASVFFLTGNGANGKSVFAKLLEEIFPPHLISHESVEDLTTNRFSASTLAGKRLNICTEEESKYLRSDKFKAIVSGESIRVERKFGSSFSIVPRTKFIFMSNSLPSFDTMDPAMLRRIKVIPFFRTFTGKESDLNLLNKLKSEIPGIVYWAREGLRRLENNNFVFSISESKASTDAIIQLESDVAAGVGFIRDWYISDESNSVSISELYDDYSNNWCQLNGRKPLRKTSFREQIEKNLHLESRMQWAPEKKLSVRGYPLKRRTDDPDIPPLFSLTSTSTSTNSDKQSKPEYL